MIEANGGKCEFDKPYSDRAFITLFLIGNNNNNNNNNNTNATKRDTEDDESHTAIYDRFDFIDDYLYFENDSFRLSRLCDLRLECFKNGKHTLMQTRITGKCKKCDIFAINESYDYSLVCHKCQYQLCQRCCHQMVLAKYINKNSNEESNNITKIQKIRAKLRAALRAAASYYTS